MIFKKRVKKQGVCFRLSPEMIEALDKIAKTNKVDRTSVIEAALAYFLEHFMGSKGDKK